MTQNPAVAARALVALALGTLVAACATTSAPTPAAKPVESTEAPARIAVAGVVVVPPPGAEWSIADVKARSVV
ncbi:MAG: hypothetical protein ABIU95_06905, partial [Burkholderiales bacterium]